MLQEVLEVLQGLLRRFPEAFRGVPGSTGTFHGVSKVISTVLMGLLGCSRGFQKRSRGGFKGSQVGSGAGVLQGRSKGFQGVSGTFYGGLKRFRRFWGISMIFN